jgi:uncharacterized lipoprotein YddW (UPF0748 family)
MCAIRCSRGWVSAGLTLLTTFAAACLIVTAQAGPVYYVDFAAGNDAADGLTRETAWRHLPGKRTGSLWQSGYVRTDFGQGTVVAQLRRLLATCSLRRSLALTKETGPRISTDPKAEVSHMLRRMLGLAMVLFATQAPAQEKEPVVLVWGEHLAAANAREAPGTRSYLENIARSLDAVGVKYARAKDSDLPKGALEGHKFAIFPYNSNLTEEEHAAIRKFVAQGGKLWASLTRDPVLCELLGVTVTGGSPSDKGGSFTGMAFTGAAPSGMPQKVANGSWQSFRIQPAEGTQVVANWTEADGSDSGVAAVTLNARGCFHTHVILGDDTAPKGRMFLALIGHFFPEMWQAAVQAALPRMTQVHGYASVEAIQAALDAARREGRNTATSQDRLRRFEQSRQQALKLSQAGDYAGALQAAEEANRALRAATYPLARSREGELRAVWMTGRATDWDAVMRELSAAGLNAVFANFCDAGGAQYESKVLPPAKDYSGDQLKACLEAAQEYGIEVHPWRVDWRLSSGTPARKEEFRAAGRLAKTLSGEETEWICPSDERNFRLEVDAMLELATKYAVAGVHFDYIRYENANYCYCEKCHANFERDARVQVAVWPKDVLKGGPHYDSFQDWRREQITRVVREVHRRAHEARPEIVVSAAVFSNWPSSRTSIGQDAAAWAKEGIIDLLMPMTYTDSNDSLAKLTDQHVALNRGRAIVAEGIGAFSSHSQFTGPDQLVQQIETARQHGADGFCIFVYGPALRQGYLGALAEGATKPKTYTIPVLRPRTVFAVNGDRQGDWAFSPGGKLRLEARVQLVDGVQGAKVPKAARFEWSLQGIDGRTLPSSTSESRSLLPGERATVSLRLELPPGAYRMAIKGEMTLTDNTRQPFICRSRPFVVLNETQAALQEGKLPAPEPTTGKPRVGVLVDGYGGQGIYAELQRVESLQVEKVTEITPEVARRCRVLVITQNRSGVGDEALARALHGWIEAGGAVLTTHDAVGYRSHPALAPEIAVGVDHLRSTTVRITKPNLAPSGVAGSLLTHAFYDHVLLKAGEKAEVVVTDEDSKPVVVTGSLGKGRYAASGIAFGLNADTQEEEPAKQEGFLLRKLVEWLAEGQKP